MTPVLLDASSHLSHIVSQMSEEREESGNELFEVLSSHGDCCSSEVLLIDSYSDGNIRLYIYKEKNKLIGN